MKLLKKTLHLNYSEPKGDKQVVKSYSFNVNADTDDTKLKEVGDEIAKLVSKNIDNTADGQHLKAQGGGAVMFFSNLSAV